MDRWVGKTAVVTGASAGIGAAIAIDLANAGLNVVGLARRKERVEELQSKVLKSSQGSLHAVKCDVTNEQEINDVFKWIVSKFGGIDVLVNNAGILRNGQLIDKDNSQNIQEVINTNILGVVYCTREAYQSMKSRGVDGHIFNINSIAGHKVPYFADKLGSLSIYPATKHAITAYTECLRQELILEKTKIKVTVSVSCQIERFESRQYCILSLIFATKKSGKVAKYFDNGFLLDTIIWEFNT